MKTSRLRLCGAILVLSATTLVAREPDIDKLVKNPGIADDTPGVAVMVIEQGEIKFAKAYGLARLDDRTPFTRQTTCELASMTKMFTAIAVLKLHEAGKLSIADDVRKHVPELPEYHKDSRITIAQLLRHTSGLPEYLAFKEPKTKAGFVTCADFAPEFARQKDKHDSRFKPGERHLYTNSNYMLLALIVERVSKKSFGEFLKEEVLTPAGMSASWVYESPKSAPNVEVKSALNAIAYAKKDKNWEPGWGSPPFRNETLLSVGDGGLWSNLDDLAKFDAAIRGDKLLKPETFKLALARDGVSKSYGFGFALTFENNTLVGFGHGGSWVFRTSYHRDIVKDRSIIILSNRDGFPVGRLQGQIEMEWDAR